MGHNVKVTCDGCGMVLRDDEASEDDRERTVSLQMSTHGNVKVLATSTDPKADPEKGTYRWRSVGWDLCVTCSRAAYEWLTERYGKAGHDSLGEVLS